MSKGKVFVPFVIDANTKQQVLAKIVKMTKEDAAKTTSEPAWQTDWDSEYISNPRLETYALKIADTDELIGLAAYLIEQNYMAVQIIYMESHPESNPTIAKKRKYEGIGKILIAYGIKLSVDAGLYGLVVLEAKTTELEKHYREHYNALPIAKTTPGAPPRFLIADSSAVEIFTTYLKSEEGPLHE